MAVSTASEKPQLLVAAPGSGKTTLPLGLLRMRARHGLTAQPFKYGPAYLDTHHHTQATGRPSINLDLFMALAACAQAIYARYLAPADAAVVGGVMGLFDGANRMADRAAGHPGYLGG